MNHMHASTGRRDQAGKYEIRLEGHLADPWGAWFDGLTLTHHTDGTTVLGPVIDQSALQSLLQTIRDLGLPLVGVGVARMAPPPASPQPRDRPGRSARAAPSGARYPRQ